MDKEKELVDFLKIEYESIAQAHFDVSSRVTKFFQYILLIYSAISLLISNNLATSIGLDQYRGYVFLIIAVVGFFLMLYICQLRWEAILYARHINGIRRKFYDLTGQKTNMNNYSLLPTQISKPNFNNNLFYIIIVITLINSAYCFAGLAFCNLFVLTANVIISVAFLGLHILLFFILSKREEYGCNFFKYNIGFDIDGVIADHRTQFCKFYNKKNGKEIRPEQLDKLPIRLTDLGITYDEEVEVFHDKDYWTSMPIMQDALLEIKSIRDQLGLKVFIFTWRDWTLYEATKNIEDITISWLKKNFKRKIYSKIYFEKGNIESPRKQREYRNKNRYYISKKKKFMFFVEDDLHKAIRLSNACKYVFLFDHPYNQLAEGDMPHNIIRVTRWSEITSKIKELF